MVVALAARREDRRFTLAREAPDRMSRRLNGVGRRGLDAEFFPVARELMHYPALPRLSSAFPEIKIQVQPPPADRHPERCRWPEG